MSLEHTILSNLVFNEPYTRQVIPFIKSEYFTDISEKLAFDLIDGHLNKYNSLPSMEALAIELSIRSDISENIFKSSKDLLASLAIDPDTDRKWLVDKTEEFCQDRAIHNALRQSIDIIGNDKKNGLSKGSIPQLLTDALAVSFDTNIGHDYLEDATKRWDYYHTVQKRIPFDLEMFNRITGNGVPNKTLNLIIAGINVGKSLCLCHLAASYLASNYNVLYITLEMAEEELAKRIDANLLNIPLNELMDIPRELYDSKIEKLKIHTKGKLIFKEYPTACAGSANFRHLINELRIKNKFKPDVVIIDYINICMSSRLKKGAGVNSYDYVKTIAEELRGLAVELDIPIWTATQLTRSGFSDSDFDMDDTAESFGLPATADFMVGVITSDTLESLGQFQIKQLKNRYADKGKWTKFIIGVDKSKMRLYDCDDPEEEAQDKPLMDKTTFGLEEINRKRKYTKNSFEGFRFDE